MAGDGDVDVKKHDDAALDPDPAKKPPAPGHPPPDPAVGAASAAQADAKSKLVAGQPPQPDGAKVPLAPTVPDVSAPPDSTAAAADVLPIAADLRLVDVEAALLLRELNDDPSMRGELGSEVALKRIEDIAARLTPIAAQISLLPAGERPALSPLARHLLHTTWMFGLGRPSVASIIPLLVDPKLSTSIGSLAGGDPVADAQAAANEKVDGKMELGQIVGLVATAYRQQVAHFHDKREKAPDLLDTSVVMRMAGAKALLNNKFADPAEADKLRPDVEAVKEQVVQIQRYVADAGGPGLRDLLIRTSDLMEAVGLGPRLTPQTMKQAMQEDAFGEASPADVAAFEAATQSYPAALTKLYAKRKDAVTMVEAETTQKDPEEPKPWWQAILLDVAFAALSWATAGIAGKLLGGKLDKIAESAGQMAKRISDEAETKTVAFVKHAGDALFEKASEASFDHIKDKIKEPAASEGSGSSTYLKVEYFHSQRDTLSDKEFSDHSAGIQAILPLRTQLGKNPAEKIEGVRKIVEAIAEIAGEAGEEQASATRIQYATMLARVALAKDDDGEKEGMQLGRATELEQKGVGGELWYKENVAGFISMEAEPGDDDVAPVKVLQAWAHGLNEGICSKLQEDREALRKMPLRVRLRVERHGFGSGGGYEYHSMAAQAGSAVVPGTATPFVRTYLAAHAGVPEETVNVHDVGAKIIEQEVAMHSFGELGVELESKG